MVRLEHISKIYNQGQKNMCYGIKDLSLKIKQGELVAIIGRSGAGKSTLMHILGCMDSYEEGEYWLNGEKIEKFDDKKLSQIRNRKIGIVLQNYALVEELTVEENVSIPLDFARKYSRKEREKRIQTVLKKVEMEDYTDYYVNYLSGGQKQRIAIARAMVNNPELILADEPTGALDSQTAHHIMELFKRLNEEGKTVIIVTHDMQVAAECNRILEIGDGVITSDCNNKTGEKNTKLK